MKIHTFIADSAPEAVAQIRAKLGRDAVVLNVRKVAPDGFRLWKKPKIEVLAHLPEPEAPVADDPLQALSELRREIADLKLQLPAPSAPKTELAAVEAPIPSRFSYDGWKVGSFLEQAGLLPKFAQSVVEEIQNEFGEKPPQTLAKELDLARAVILQKLERTVGGGPSRGETRSFGTHIFVGPPGCGKTTALSKRLAQLSLIENLPARVLRLDGERANTAESLSVYCEILGVPVERCLTSAADGLTFVDLPGVAAADSEGLNALSKQIAQFPGAQIHLTLNAAYDTTILMAQARAFSALPITDLVCTHLDEEQRWGKLLNFAFGTKFTIGFLSAGQNVPGNFAPATSEKIVSRVIPSK